jgi:hypothetical protein
MDEIEFKRAYNNLRVLIDHIPDEGDTKIHVRNAMLTIAAMLDGLHQRIDEIAATPDDDDE